MATYSQTATGYVTGSLLGPKSYNIPDLDLGGNSCVPNAGMAQTMAQGDQMLVKGPDGSLHWYKYDAERSTVANPVLIYVGP